MSAKDKRLYQIACSFPALQLKGVEKDNIPVSAKMGFMTWNCPNTCTRAGAVC